MANLDLNYPGASLVRHHEPALYYSAFLLPKKKRRQLLSLFGFLLSVRERMEKECREGGENLQKVVLELTLRLGNLYKEDPPGGQNLESLRTVIEEHRLPRMLFIEFFDGISLNMVRLRYRDWTQLKQYLRTTAVVPAMLAAPILGAAPEAAAKYLPPLGMAWQLATILTDLDRGISQGKIYLPLQEIEEHNLTLAELASLTPSEPMLALIRSQVQRARRLIEEGLPILDHLPTDGSQRWARTLITAREQSLKRLEDDPASALDGKARIGTLDKIKVLWKTG